MTKSTYPNITVAINKIVNAEVRIAPAKHPIDNDSPHLLIRFFQVHKNAMVFAPCVKTNLKALKAVKHMTGIESAQWGACYDHASTITSFRIPIYIDPSSKDQIADLFVKIEKLANEYGRVQKNER